MEYDVEGTPPHKGYIVHPLDQLRNFFAGTDDGYILNGIVQGRHPGIAFRDGKLRREIAAEHFCKTLCGAVCFVAVCFFCKIKHGRLVFRRMSITKFFNDFTEEVPRRSWKRVGTGEFTRTDFIGQTVETGLYFQTVKYLYCLMGDSVV